MANFVVGAQGQDHKKTKITRTPTATIDHVENLDSVSSLGPSTRELEAFARTNLAKT